MENFEKFNSNVQKLIMKYQELKKENTQLTEKITRIEKDLNFHVNRNQKFPEVILRNKRLISDREIFADRIDSILKKLDSVKV